jgi:hypothetical protein
MFSGVPRPNWLLALLALVVPAAGSAAPASAPAIGQAALLSPLSVVKNGDLDFGDLVAGGAGTAVIDPVGGALSTTGGVIRVGASAHAATFTGTGSKNSVVHIRLPASPITVTRAGGTETMTVSNFTLDGLANRKVPPSDVFTFAVGGTLNVAAGQAQGTYAGTFTVTVQYP